MARLETLDRIVAEHHGVMTDFSKKNGSEFNPKAANQLLLTAEEAVLGVTDLNLIEELIERTRGSESGLVLPDSDLWRPDQGYYGGITPEGSPLLAPNGLPKPEEDPIALAFRDNYPLMAVTKSLRVLLGESPEEVAKRLDSTLGFGRLGELAIGTTGFMPSENFESKLGKNTILNDAMLKEETEAFRGSGGMDHLAALAIRNGTALTKEAAMAELSRIAALGVTIN